jgi:hypothetical protein
MSNMVAVVTAQTVELAAHSGCFDTGRALQGAGSVTDVEPADFGVSGFVADADEDFDVWVGIRHRMIVGECECPDADPQGSSEESLAAVAEGRAEAAGLCAHAVAVALAGIEHGLPWAPAPSESTPSPTD